MWAPYCEVYAPVSENNYASQNQKKIEIVDNKHFEFIEYKKIESSEIKK